MIITFQMSKLAIIPIFFLTMCGTAPVTPPAEACSPRLDGQPTNCGEDFVILPREEIRGEIDIYDPMHWHQMQTMFQRNARRNQIEQTATKPSDAINSALAEYNYGSNDTTEQEELLQLQSHGD